MAFCGEPGLLDGRRDVLLNPSLLVEVLSDSTEAYDRGDRFALYRLGAVRLRVGEPTTAEEIQAAAEVLIAAWRSLVSR